MIRGVLHFFYCLYMDNLPSEVQNIIIRWTCEFDRVDAMERMDAFRSNYGETMRSISRDISHNVPLYVFNILTQSDMSLCISVMLPDCDPHKVDVRHRIPESFLVSYNRCSLTLRKHAYTNLQSTIYCTRPMRYSLGNEIVL
jgi:hypothetical protein